MASIDLYQNPSYSCSGVISPKFAKLGHLMETSELPVLDESVEEEAPVATCTEQEIDLAAFELWREASRPGAADEAR